MLIAVTGYRGMLGSELVRRGCEAFPCDVTVPGAVTAAYDALRPDAIINCAVFGGCGQVDACEQDEKRAYAVNVRGIGNLRWFIPEDCRIIHLSTSYVFDGRRGPYDEHAKPNPVQAYGFTKLAGECLFQTEMLPGDSIVRTVGLYGGHKDDFAKYVVKTLRDGGEVRALRNLSFNPTYVPHLAQALIHIACMQEPPRLVNVAGEDILSRYEFALAVADAFHLETGAITPVDHVDAISAPRPPRAGLKVGYARRLGIPLHSVNEGLQAMVEAMYAPAD